MRLHATVKLEDLDSHWTAVETFCTNLQLMHPHIYTYIYIYYLYHNIILCIYCVYYIIHIVVSSFESLLQDATKALAYGPNGAAYGISQAQWDHGRPWSTIVDHRCMDLSRRPHPLVASMRFGSCQRTTGRCRVLRERPRQ